MLGFVVPVTKQVGDVFSMGLARARAWQAPWKSLRAPPIRHVASDTNIMAAYQNLRV